MTFKPFIDLSKIWQQLFDCKGVVTLINRGIIVFGELLSVSPFLKMKIHTQIWDHDNDHYIPKSSQLFLRTTRLLKPNLKKKKIPEQQVYQVGFSLTEVKVSHICLALTQIAEGARLESFTWLSLLCHFLNALNDIRSFQEVWRWGTQ